MSAPDPLAADLRRIQSATAGHYDSAGARGIVALCRVVEILVVRVADLEQQLAASRAATRSDG